MRTMPFRVVQPEAINCHDPELVIGGRTYSPGEPVDAWDYLQECQLTGHMKLDEQVIRKQSGLPSLAAVSALLSVDCPATGHRLVTTVPVLGRKSVDLLVTVPAHTMAAQLEVRYGLVLDQPITQDLATMAAHRRGSRLLSDPNVWRFDLEGIHDGFPIEAFDFEPVGLPPQAAWHLQFRVTSLHEPYMAAVRLQVNTSHPQAATLLQNQSATLPISVLRFGIIEQLLLTVADQHREQETEDSFEPGTVGAVLNELCEQYWNRSLSDTVRRVRFDRGEFLSQLQSKTRFLQGES